jgi:hypothetical protein
MLFSPRGRDDAGLALKLSRCQVPRQDGRTQARPVPGLRRLLPLLASIHFTLMRIKKIDLRRIGAMNPQLRQNTTRQGMQNAVLGLLL